ncbi:MAG: sulfotransferase family protein [Chloroflexi bacterium]|nr:sulfotransferase family protein [Chloroflexota bacterium]
MNLREIESILSYHLGYAKYLFIHIPKNAGVSVRKSPMLRGRLISADPYFHKSREYTRTLAKTMREAGEHHGFQHARWRDINPEVTARLRSVAIIRNPWARTVSRFRFALTAMENGKAPQDYCARDFEGFLEERYKYGDKPYYWHRAIRGWYSQLDYVTDEDGKLRTDILRMENMDNDVVEYFQLVKPLSRRNVSSAKSHDYREYYNDRTIQIIADWYQRDVDFFGFDFEGGATRNCWNNRVA